MGCFGCAVGGERGDGTSERGISVSFTLIVARERGAGGRGVQWRNMLLRNNFRLLFGKSFGNIISASLLNDVLFCSYSPLLVIHLSVSRGQLTDIHI